MKLPHLTLAAASVLLFAAPAAADAFPKEAGPAKECAECHTLTREEAGKLLGKVADNVIDVVPGPFPGIWEVDVEKGGRKYPLYLDYSGKYLFNGQVVRLDTMENVTALRFSDLNRVDVSSIPLGNAVVIGNPKAKAKVIVFDDPDCPWCRKLHGEINQALARDPDVAFFVLLYSRNNNPASVQKVQSIVCGKKNAAKLLDDAFAGKQLPPPACKTSAPEDTATLARKLGIQATPSLVLPDGRLISGYRTADALLELIRPKK
jgi:thiol:disulfide interchange protein DsbC